MVFGFNKSISVISMAICWYKIQTGKWDQSLLVAELIEYYRDGDGRYKKGEKGDLPETPQEVDKEMEEIVLLVQHFVLNQSFQDDVLREQVAVIEQGGDGGGRLTHQRRHQPHQ